MEPSLKIFLYLNFMELRKIIKLGPIGPHLFDICFGNPPTEKQTNLVSLSVPERLFARIPFLKTLRDPLF